MLISHDSHPQMVSGAEKALLLFGSACKKRNMKVSWITPKQGLSYERAKWIGMDTCVISFPLLWSLIHEPARIPDQLNLFHNDADRSELEQIITDDPPNLILANSAINTMPIILAHKRKVPIWWYIHEVIPPHEEMEQFISLISSHVENRILAPSKAVANTLVKAAHTSNSVQLLPYGVEIPSYYSMNKSREAWRDQNGWTEGHLVVGWFGSIYHGKGLLDLLRAAANFKNSEKDILIIAAGNIVDPGYFDLCNQEAKHLGSVKFRYMGVLPSIEAILPAVDLVVLPSLVEEGFPNVALEAMAFGKCVVAYASGGLKEMILHDETGLLTGKGDIVSLSASIQSLIQDPPKMIRMGIKGQEHVRNVFSLTLFEARLQTMIDQWIAERGERGES